jgi:peptidoglycan/LPS O-acetylase OafA/YrhL
MRQRLSPLADSGPGPYSSAMTSIGHDDARADIAPNQPASGTELALWTLVVVVTFPFGVIVAAVLAFTRLRHNRVARWLLLGLTVAVLALVLIGLYGPTTTSVDTEPAERVN